MAYARAYAVLCASSPAWLGVPLSLSPAAGTRCTNSSEINTYTGRYMHVLKGLGLPVASTEKSKKLRPQAPRNEHFQNRLAGGGLE
jgi:hypothetical protein